MLIVLLRNVQQKYPFLSLVTRHFGEVSEVFTLLAVTLRLVQFIKRETRLDKVPSLNFLLFDKLSIDSVILVVLMHFQKEGIGIKCQIKRCVIILNGNENADCFAHFIDDLGHHRDLGGYNNDDVIINSNQ